MQVLWRARDWRAKAFWGKRLRMSVVPTLWFAEACMACVESKPICAELARFAGEDISPLLRGHTTLCGNIEIARTYAMTVENSARVWFTPMD